MRKISAPAVVTAIVALGAGAAWADGLPSTSTAADFGTDMFWVISTQNMEATVGSAPVVTAPPASSPFILWAQNSLTLLYGNGFLVDPSEQVTLTFEHTSASRIGDLFFFLDVNKYLDSADGTDGAWYSEISPRLSFGKMLGSDMSFGSDSFGVSDVLIAAQYERGDDPSEAEAVLLGVGFDVKMPGFDFLQLNIYGHNNLNDPGDGGFDETQITMVGGHTFESGSTRIIVDGYFDWIPSFGSDAPSFHFNPQVKLDVGNYWGNPNRIFAGLEFDLWWNKYQIESSPVFDTDQQAVSALVQVRF